MAKKTKADAVEFDIVKGNFDEHDGFDIEVSLQKKLKSHDDGLKAKVGYQCWSTSPDASNYYHLWGFAKKEDYAKYIADPDNESSLLIFDEALPISTVQGDSYGAYLFTSLQGTKDIVVSGEKLEIPLRFHAVRTSNGDRLNMGTAALLVIQRSTDNGITWQTVDTRNASVPSTDYTDTNTYTAVDVSNCLINGSQRIRIRAQFNYTNEDGSIKTATSTYVAVGNSVTKANLSLSCQLNWQTPLLASVYKDRGFPISYMVFGAVTKVLHISITGGNNTVMPEITYPLSASDDSTNIAKSIVDATDSYKLFKHGVRTVKAWLTCEDGLGGTISSEVLVNRFMMINKEDAGVNANKPYLMLQNVISKADNYAQADICQYSVFSPSVSSDGTISNTGAKVPVIFYLTDYSENFPADNPVEYFKIENSVTPGEVNTLNTIIEIEAGENKTVSAYLRIYRKETGGSEINFLQESQNTNNIVITVDNSESYAPKSGADFLLNPKVRNNSESNPAQILNSRANNAVIESTWRGFGFVNDGWVTSDFDKQKILRIPAGAKLNFKYNPFAQFLTTADSAMTLELDFAVRNITNEDDPIISVCETLGSLFRGLRLKPMSGNVFTKSNTVDSETDFSWSEGVRTHLVINIHNAVAPNKGDVVVPEASTGLAVSATKIALVRIFVNGDCERELKFSITDTEEFGTSTMGNGGFTLGQKGADLDIYSIRCYQNTALDATEVLNNYISTLPTTIEKVNRRKANDILTSGKVDIEKVKKLGKRCLVWHGKLPYHESTSKQNGWWEIVQFDKKGNYLPEYSGTICKETKSLKSSRQGSTANTYFWSNLQTKCGDVKATINVRVEDFHSSIVVSEPRSVNIPTAEGGTASMKVVGIYGGNLGKYDPVKNEAKEYPYNDDGTVTVPDGWIDGNGKYRGMGYQVSEGTPLASKLVNKINYASSMQSHLTGANNLYNDLHKEIVGKNSLQEACSTARVSKYTEPFFFFYQEEGQASPVYNGPCTFGAGKMDKPTWGYVKKLHPNFCMIEGSDNNYDLTDMRVPFTWNEPDCSECITYRGGSYEGFFYNGKQCLDFDAGATQDDAEGTPKENIIKAIQDTWNFLYLHAPMIAFYKGTFESFQKSEQAKDVFKKYWCTDGEDAYRLKRYDHVNNKWVDAGLWSSATKAWIIVDLRKDKLTKQTFENSSNQSQFSKLNEEFRAAIVAHCSKYMGFYFKVDSVKLYYAHIIHLLAGTDNCSKNTYFVLDPKAVQVTIDGETRSCNLFEMHTDDVDTLLPIDNNGRATKKYYIDRMHPYNDGDSATAKYEGMNNVLFNLCEAMWEDTKELQAMLKRILSVMEGLVRESDYIDGWAAGSKVSVWGCLYKYIYYVHHYFPEVAFNEAARIRYEYPEMLGFVSSGSGARGVKPITQSNGSLLQCELQFMKRRLVLMASYAAWGPFFDGKTGNIGIAEATDSFSMQAYHLPDSATSNNNYTFNVTPHQYIYPVGMMGQTSIDPHVRVAPGQSFALNLGDTTSNDTGMAVLGINYYRSLGNLGNLSTTPANTLTIKGNRLTEFIAEPSVMYVDSDTKESVPAFRPGGIVISAPNIQRLTLKGLVSTSGSIDLSGLKRLQTVDLRQTSFTDISIPETNIISSVMFPATVSGVEITNQQSLKTLTLEGYANLKKFIVRNNKLVDTFSHATGIYVAKPTGLRTIDIDNIRWDSDGKRCTVDMISYLASMRAALKGIIILVTATIDRYLTLPEKLTLVALYGNIDDKSNALYVKYDLKDIVRISISGQNYMTEVGKDYEFSVIPAPQNGNNIAVRDGKLALRWSLADTANPYAQLVDDNIGIVHVKGQSEATLKQKHILKVEATPINGGKLETTKPVGFYRHIPEVGDFAYSDGTFDDDYDATREIVGQVFMRNTIYDEVVKAKIKGYDVRIYAKENLTLAPSGNRTTPMTKIRFGMYPDSSNGHWDERVAIREAVGFNSDYEIFDIPTILNVDCNLKKADGSRYNYINDETYLDPLQESGYKKIDNGFCEADYNGKEKTKSVVAHADKIISYYLEKKIPTSLQELVDAMQKIIEENSSVTNSWRYDEYYYPAVYGCYLYEPTVEGTLDEQYKAKRWYCPAEGELCRLYNFYRQGVAKAQANYSPASEAVTPIMANANAKANSIIFTFINDWYWSTSESSQHLSWILNFGSGNLSYTGKCSSYYVRPCTAFNFIL